VFRTSRAAEAAAITGGNPDGSSHHVLAIPFRCAGPRSTAFPTCDVLVSGLLRSTHFETSRGTITLELTRAWAPNGVDHFYNLARAGYYDDSRFFRVIYGFIAQFGISKDPAAANLWGSHTIRADSLVEHNTRGTISYAQFKPTDRTTNIFINLHDNANLDSLKFVPIGRVTAGMEAADSLFSGYGELPSSEAPLGNPKRLYAETNKYLDEKYPKLDKIIKITIHTDAGTPPSTPKR